MLKEIRAAISDTAEALTVSALLLEIKLEHFPDILIGPDFICACQKILQGKYQTVFNSLETNLAKIKIKKDERKFIPHITIARIKENLNTGTADLIKKVSFNFKGSIICSKITLFESRLKPSGADYIILEEFALK